MPAPRSRATDRSAHAAPLDAAITRPAGRHLLHVHAPIFRTPDARRSVIAMAITLMALGVAAGLLEWAGWRIVWRHGEVPAALDAHWRAAFLAGAARNFAGACSVGTVLAGVTLGLGTARAWGGAATRRRAAVAFVMGAAGLLAILTGLTLWAP